MATGDIKYFQNEAIIHAKNFKKLLNQGKELRDYWDKLNCVADTGTALQAPLIKADMDNYATLLNVLKDFVDNVAVPAGDRRSVIERVASFPVSKDFI